MRYFIEFAYNGKNYHGWQRQPSAISVQETLENALSLLLRENITVTGAGRTDAGVHAKQMFAHFESTKLSDFDFLINRLNAFLPSDIAITNVFEVAAEAHARFDAISRTYEYWVVNKKDPFLSAYSYYCHKKPDVNLMNEAAELLYVYKDFQCFSKSNTDVKTYLCDISQASWKVTPDKLVFTITADRFLRNMVRAIVGTLLDVGLGKISKEDVKKIIESKNRSMAGVSVPAHALYLTSVVYAQPLS
ncbi:tRNA pseudouridine(38-40) synthase TruA [Ascidiimonas sp. W6]|uniref:tRNA pseudouridine(38-40) synthase TruA n=1 Tax=Ascidiimonas meishanensis TaxID=3128903 RepID=UPI0030EDDAEC